jgi:RNA polymerase sigma-70 factor (ECF subfamily)
MDKKFTEQDAIRASQEGDLESFNILILRYQDFLFRMAFRILGDEDMACDAVQETCLLVFKKISSYREGSFRGWLARIITNVCYDELRHQGRSRTQSLDSKDQDENEMEASYWLADFSTNPERQLEALEFTRTIQRCLEMISPQHQLILILIDIEDFSYEEAAVTLKYPLARSRAVSPGLEHR